MRHAKGDWGELDPEDWQANERALLEGTRLVSVSPRDAFEMLYKDIEREFEGTEYAKEVRLALYRRFTGAVDRSVFTALSQ